ncbi:MAG: hypothetical protein WBG48_05460 [Pricia sp.]
MLYIVTHFKKILSYALIIFGCGYLSAQEADGVETPSIETILQSNALMLTDLTGPAEPSANASGSAYIYQIGNDNIGKIKTYGENNAVELVQNGNANRADINVSANTVVHSTLQNGNGNVFLEYGKASHLNLERTILQNGNHQNLSIFGSNSLTESIQLNMEGDAQALTIRSFN